MKTTLKNILTTFICLLGLGIFQNGHTQNYPHHFSKEDGLLSNQVYDCIQDKQGYIWIATADGISKYDGTSFEHFTTQSGLPSAFIWRLFEDSKGRIWLGNNQTPLSYIWNDSVHRIGAQFPQFYFENILEDATGNVYIVSLKEDKTYLINAKEEVVSIDSVLLLITQDDQKIWRDPLQTKINFFRLKSNSNQYTVITSEDYKKNQTQQLLYLDKNDDTLLKLTKDQDYDQFYYYNFFDQKPFLSYEKGIAEVRLHSKHPLHLIVPRQEGVLHPETIAADHNKNLWVSDIRHGLFYFERLPKSVKFSYHPDHQIVSRSLSFDSINYNLFFDESKLAQHYLNDSVLYDYINDGNSSAFCLKLNNLVLYRHYPGLLLESSDGLDTTYVSFDNQAVIEHSPQNSTLLAKTGAVKTGFKFENEVLFGTHLGIYRFDLGTDTVRVEKAYSGYVYGIARDENTLYAGTNEGLSYRDESGIWKLALSGGVSDVLVTQRLIIVRKENGSIVLLDKESFEVLKTINSFKENLGIHLVKNHVILRGDEIFGFFPVNNPDSLAFVYKGLCAGKVLSVQKVNDNIRLVCEKGNYDFKEFSDWKKEDDIEPFFVHGLSINKGKVVDLTILPSNKTNLLLIDLKALKYPSNKDLTYWYKVDEGEWSQSQQSQITILNLPYGEYEITLKAVDKYGTQFGSVIVLQVIHSMPFYLTSWFIILMTALFFIFVILFIVRGNRKRYKMISLSFELLQNKQKMLIMQMKPHFLSNLFNSLQVGVLDEDAESNSALLSLADRYLRKTLKASNSTLVTLREEIETVEDYVELERMRFKIPIELRIDANLKQYWGRTMLPVFTLQPLLENSLWHGIHKSTSLDIGIISIQIEEEQDHYRISIIDNGAGQGEVKTIQGNSISLKNIEKRLSLIDQKNRKTYVEFVPLDQGTQVNLYVAKKTKNYSH